MDGLLKNGTPVGRVGKDHISGVMTMILISITDWAKVIKELSEIFIYSKGSQQKCRSTIF